MRKYTVEFIGTFFLVMAIGLAAGPFAPIAIGGTLMVMVYMGGHISGAHYNPAVTFAVWVCRKMPAAEVVPYIVSQLLAAITAAGVIYALKKVPFAPKPSADVDAWHILLVEVLFTFALVLVILNVAVSAKTRGNYIYGLAIGSTVMISAFLIGGISGAVLNPAVGVGPILVEALLGGKAYADVAFYLVGPLGGGFLAALMFKFLNPDEIEAR